MKRLYTPWRSKYARSVEGAKQENATANECVFCIKLAEKNDDKHYILGRFEHNMVVLNLYPYNAGHLLILPLEHKPCLSDLSAQARAEAMELISKSIDVVKKVLGAQGVNVGMNVGKQAGAGIPSHVHIHVLPRWQGDTNFMSLLAQTKVIAFDLNDIYAQLKPHFIQL